MSFTESLARKLFGITLKEAQDRNICIRCKSPTEVNDWSPADADEYLISGLCPLCFAKICPNEEED